MNHLIATLRVPPGRWIDIADYVPSSDAVLIRDDSGNYDIANFTRGEWNCEFGDVEKPTHFYPLHITNQGN